MAKGHEDWGVNINALSYQNTDIGELAIKQGYGDSISRSGKLAWFQKFDIDYAGVTTLSSGSGSVAVHQNNDGFTSSGIVSLIAGTATTSFTRLRKYLPYFGARTHGIASYIKVIDQISELYLYCHIHNGSTTYKAVLYLEGDTFLNKVRTTGGTFQTIQEDRNLTVGVDAPFNFLKLTFDIEAVTYLTAQINDTILDISDIALDTEVTASNEHTTFTVEVDGDGDEGMEAYVDSMYYTIDEPE